MPIPASIAERVETFRRNLDSYLAPDYKETELRREFLDPLFDALGWDVFNRQGYAEAYKDVVHEDMLKIGGQSTAPDYSFRVGGVRKFFVEAKKPAVRIKDDPAPAAQLRRYSWTAKLPLGIATDFQEFAIYDTRVRPRADDKASTGRIFYCTYEEFADKWDEIATIFSKDAVLKGSFDKYAAANRGKRGTAEFDADFLADLEAWRKLLAVNLAKRNDLDERELNFAVQRILDRIVFLRIAEDRGIEPLGQLQALTAGPRIYPRLREIFERADFRYNSGLFHFATERGRDEAPDRLTLGLELDDAVLKEILSALYWPKSPYAFAVVSADILGNVYEQFLGKVIQLDGAHRVKVDEKPEVRKAGGVYYTPTYIVDYIVRQTVGPLVAGKTPKQVEKLRVLDPACGSGSFLLGAYEFLLAWYLDYYSKNDPAAWAKKKTPPIYETAPNAHGLGKGNSGWRLTTEERKRILVAHIHGVDIDAQAVEVTKLSLLLKVLEGEARELQGKQLEFHRVLPDLGNNIKCGNSLIGPDFYAQPDLPALDDAARYKINAFDWAEEFKPVFAQGGFDAVIGNPPYIFTRELFTVAERNYYRASYATAEDKHNTFVLFMLKLLNLTREHGRSGLIVPNSWLTVESCAQLRKCYAEHLDDVVDLNYQVWPRVSLEPSIFIVQKNSKSPEFNVTRTHSESEIWSKQRLRFAKAAMHTEQSRIVFGFDSTSEVLLYKLSKTPSLATRFDVRTGLQAYEKGKGTPPQTTEDVANHVFDRKSKLDATCHRYLEGRDVGRFSLQWGGMWMSWGPWLSQPRELATFQRPRILIREITGKPPRRFFATYTEEDFLSNKSVVTILHSGNAERELRALLGILNSKVISFFYQGRAVKSARKLFPKIVINNLREFPLPQKFISDQLVTLVERMLKLHADLAAAKSPDAQTRLQREIKATDVAIDRLVYALYDLTPEEIALVEAATAPAAKAADAEANDVPAPLPPGATAQAEIDAAHHYSLNEELKPYA